MDEPGVSTAQLGRIEAVFLQAADAQIVEQHVARLEQRMQGPAILLLAEVEDDAALVAVDGDEGRAVAAAAARAAERIAFRSFDLDHVRAHVSEHLAGQRRGDESADFDDTNPLQHEHSPRQRDRH